MKHFPVRLGVVAAAFPLLAAGGTPCEEVKAALAAKLDAKGIVHYSLDVVANDQVGDQKVIGSCERGTKKILYKRGTSP